MSDPDRGQDGGHGEGRGAGEPERAPLGILFLAAAVGLVLLLTIVGLVAFAAMSRP